MKVLFFAVLVLCAAACSKQGDESKAKSDASRDASFIVKTTDEVKVYSQKEKTDAKNAATELIFTMKTVSKHVADPQVMFDSATYYKAFDNPLNNKIAAWPNMLDSRRDLYANLNYCVSAALALQMWGMQIHQKNIPEEFLKQRQRDYLIELPKCETAIDLYK